MSEQALVFAAFTTSTRPGRRLGRRIAVLASLLAHIAGLWVLATHRPAPVAAAAAAPPEPILLRLPALRARHVAQAVAAPKPERPRPVRPPAVLTQPQPVVEPPAPPAPVAEAEPTDGEEGDEGEPAAVSTPGAAVGSPVGISAAPGDQLFELREVARPPAVLAQETPEYPRQARFDRIEGTVVLRVIVGADGRVEAGPIQVIRSVPALDAAAIAAIRQWRFSPALGPSGRPVRVVIEVPFQFSLR